MSELWSDLLACWRHGPKITSPPAIDGFGTTGCSAAKLLAQFLRAAALVCPEKSVKSLHALFPREGRADEPVEYDGPSPAPHRELTCRSDEFQF